MVGVAFALGHSQHEHVRVHVAVESKVRPSHALQRLFHHALGRVRVFAIGAEKVLLAHLPTGPVQHLLHGGGLLLGKRQ
jgi:hypothetical protein